MTENLAPLDLAGERRAAASALAAGEMDALTAKIDVNDMNSILAFGSGATARLAAASDAALREVARPRLDDSGEGLAALASLMERFDPDALDREPGRLGRLFGRRRDRLDGVLDDYHALAAELDRVYGLLRAHQRELLRDNRRLEALLRADADDYRELEKHVLAGEQGCREIREYLDGRQAALDAGGGADIAFEVQTLKQALAALERRVADLRTAEAAALQAIPMIRAVQLDNQALAQKIDDAFLVTLPLFHRALTDAVERKRRALRDAALEKVRAGDAADAVGGLAAARRQILDGIAQVRAMQADARRRRERDRRALEQELPKEHKRGC